MEARNANDAVKLEIAGTRRNVIRQRSLHLLPFSPPCDTLAGDAVLLLFSFWQGDGSFNLKTTLRATPRAFLNTRDILIMLSLYFKQ